MTYLELCEEVAKLQSAIRARKQEIKNFEKSLAFLQNCMQAKLLSNSSNNNTKSAKR